MAAAALCQPWDDVKMNGGNGEPQTIAVKVLGLFCSRNLPFQTQLSIFSWVVAKEGNVCLCVSPWKMGALENSVFLACNHERK